MKLTATLLLAVHIISLRIIYYRMADNNNERISNTESEDSFWIGWDMVNNICPSPPNDVNLLQNGFVNHESWDDEISQAFQRLLRNGNGENLVSKFYVHFHDFRLPALSVAFTINTSEVVFIVQPN